MNAKIRLKNKVKVLFNSCSEELKKTTAIGKKMFMASKTNTELHESYEELGMLIYKMSKEERVDISEKKVTDLILRIDSLEEEIRQIELEVQKLKVASGPEDISKNS